jgi:hypothetical protein
MARGPSRQASYSAPISRVESPNRALACASASASSALARATGSRKRIAAYAGTLPERTSSWMAAGSSRTSPSRRETQLGLLANRAANSSSPQPALAASSASSHPCSSAVSPRATRKERTRRSASASAIGHTTARTVSCPSRESIRTRAYPSMSTKRSAAAAGTTTTGVCCPTSESDATSRRSPSRLRTRKPEYRRSSW